MSTTKFYERDLGTASRPINNLHVNSINNAPAVQTLAGIGMTGGDADDFLTIPNDQSTSGTVILSDAITPPISGSFLVPGGLAVNKEYKLTALYTFQAPGVFREIQFHLKYNGMLIGVIYTAEFPVVDVSKTMKIEAIVYVTKILDGDIFTNVSTNFSFDGPGSRRFEVLGQNANDQVNTGTNSDRGFELFVNNNKDNLKFKLTYATLDY